MSEIPTDIRDKADFVVDRIIEEFNVGARIYEMRRLVALAILAERERLAPVLRQAKEAILLLNGGEYSVAVRHIDQALGKPE